MRQAMIASVVCCLLVLVVFTEGCGKAREAADAARNVGEAARFAKDMQDGEGTFKTDEGEVKVEKGKDGETMTIKTDEGEMVVTGKEGDEEVVYTMKDKDGKVTTVAGGKSVDVADLSLELYPGAEKETGYSTTADGMQRMAVVLKTKDNFDNVAKFYKSKYPDAQSHAMDMGEERMLMLMVSDAPEVKSISVSKSKEEDFVRVSLTEEKKSE